MSASILPLSFAYWLHMLATVVWIGGLAALAIFVLPAARAALEPGPYAAFLAALQRRLDALGWFCLLILVATGLFQMSASPHYQGFLAIQNLWAGAILLKHLLFFSMAGVSAYLTWGLAPRLRRLALLQAHQAQAGQAGAEQAARLQKQELNLLRLNLLLGMLILALTALARSA
jgi:uncharacterized membrane protein